MRIRTPLVLWHGGGMTNGKPDPVFAVDIHPTNVLATAGVDSSVPPRGSVHLWKLDERCETQTFIFDLCDHQSAVHTVRFSPCGLMLAAASDRLITIYKVASGDVWAALTDMKQVNRVWVHSNLGEIYDLAWSPDGDHLVAGSIDSKAEILRVEGRETLSLTGHSNYVQGVAWDPLGEMVATQSADRSVKIYPLRARGETNTQLKLATRGQMVLRSLPSASTTDTEPTVAASVEGAAIAGGSDGLSVVAQKGQILFASSTESCFFRRPTFTPDGALLIAPMGIHAGGISNTPSSSSERGDVGTPVTTSSYCTHVFGRASLQQGSSSGSSPIYSLVGLDEPSVAVRCSPRLYTMVDHSGVTEAAAAARMSPVPVRTCVPNVLEGRYRMIFAVVTSSSVLLYDTQHHHPIVRVRGIHYATINDAAWSADGNTLTVCSSDGYVTFIRFADGELGTLLPDPEVPARVKAACPGVYSYLSQTAACAASNATTAVVAASTTHTAENRSSGDQMGEEDGCENVAASSVFSLPKNEAEGASTAPLGCGSPKRQRTDPAPTDGTGSAMTMD